jgi:hypothetical protein
MIVEGEKNPDWVWKRKGVVRPAGKKKAFYCRVFDEAQTVQAGVKVKDWSSLDEHLDLIPGKATSQRNKHDAPGEICNTFQFL